VLAEAIAEWVEGGDAEVLTEGRATVSAYELRHRRLAHHEQERHFAAARLLTEAGIGVLAFNGCEDLGALGLANHTVTACKKVAAVFERGILLDLLPGIEVLALSPVANEFARRGYSHTPADPFGWRACGANSIQWATARRWARELGIPLTDLPASPEISRAWNRRRQDAARRMGGVYTAQRRDEARNAARVRGDVTAEVYAMAERFGDLLAQWHRETGDSATRGHLAEATAHYHKMRDEIVRALGVAG
jgi:HAMP domain-containing protein